MTKSASASLSNTEDEYGLRTEEESNMIDFQRALEIIGKENKAKKQRLSPRPGQRDKKPSWQSMAMSSLEESDRWVFGCTLQKLWPYKDTPTCGRTKLIVVYPDVFNNLGLEDEADAKNEESFSDGERWENNVSKGKHQGSIFAVLPLLQTMGAIVSSHLHNNVTHVLCEMKSKKVLQWTSTLPRSVYSDPEAGALLHERLTSLEESAVLSGNEWSDVMLVSPLWVEEKWKE